MLPKFLVQVLGSENKLREALSGIQFMITKVKTASELPKYANALAAAFQKAFQVCRKIVWFMYVGFFP
jgi:hypothetical protein